MSHSSSESRVVTGEEAATASGAPPEEHFSRLEHELQSAEQQEAETAQQLERARQRRAAVEQQLREAGEETTRLSLEEATRTRNAVLAEAEKLLEASRVDAHREADEITQHASDKADEIVALARRQAMAIVDAGREEITALRDRAAQRNADRDSKHRELMHRMGLMETICDELAATLKLVAELSIEALVETEDSTKQPDIGYSRRLQPELDSQSNISASAPQDEHLDLAQANADRQVEEARATASKKDQVPPPERGDASDDANGEEVAIIIDDRDLGHRRSRFGKWLNLRRDHDANESGARVDEALSERFRRVVSLSREVDGADPEEVEARIRNLSHGTNSQ